MTTKERLRGRWQQLQALDTAPLKVRQKRGYELEQFMFDLLQLEGLNPALPYRGVGEQIDGMFEMGERYFSISTCVGAESSLRFTHLRFSGQG